MDVHLLTFRTLASLAIKQYMPILFKGSSMANILQENWKGRVCILLTATVDPLRPTPPWIKMTWKYDRAAKMVPTTPMTTGTSFSWNPSSGT